MHGASVLVGEVKSALLDGDTKNYDMERGFSRHPIDESGDRGIVVKLGMPCIINRVNMLLWDRDQRAYRYFRVVGTHNTVNKVFHVVTLEALWSDAVLPLYQGLVVPQENIASLAHSALVIEGVCRSRNALLNGDTSHYDWDSGYTCHQLGSGAIMVQLGQPYALNSMRMLLWDCDDRSYNYYIEVSVNQRDWEVVCDRTREPARSWQMISFPRRPVVFIRIVGTHNTANEVFHCVHFEAPAMGDAEGGTTPVVQSSSGGESSQDELESPEQELLLLGEEPDQGRNLLQGIPLDQQVHNVDPFQLPLVGAGAFGVPPVLPMGGVAGATQGAGAMQGIDGGHGRGQPGHVMGAVPRAIRSARQSNNSNSPS